VIGFGCTGPPAGPELPREQIFSAIKEGCPGVAIRVIIADDNERVIGALTRLLRGECEVVAAVKDGPNLVASVVELLPDLVITDVSMPGGNGLDALRQLQQRGVIVKAIVVSADDDARLVAAAAAAGARGFIVKGEVGQRLLGAIRDVTNGLTYFPPSS
jgi:DNA-binding NarL/FixJ family response regulator